MSIIPKEMLYTDNKQRRTRSLFKETCAGHETPIANLSRHEQEGLIHVRSLYLFYATQDPSEYMFAEAVFGDYSHWDTIANAGWMRPYIEEWRAIAAAERKSLAFKAIIQEVTTNGRSAFTAAKYLIEEPWKDKRNPKVKEEVNKSTTDARKAVDSDVARIQEFMTNKGK